MNHNNDVLINVSNLGHTITSDIFIILKNVYFRTIETTLTTTETCGGGTIYRSTSRSKYFKWCYVYKTKKEIDVITYNTQLNVFNFCKQRPDFRNELLQEMLDNELEQFALQSELLF